MSVKTARLVFEFRVVNENLSFYQLSRDIQVVLLLQLTFTLLAVCQFIKYRIWEI